MKLNHEFNVGDLPESDMSFGVIPEGWYDATINTAEVKSTKDGTGSYINIRFDITGPSHAGRVVFGKINTNNKSEKAEQIGLQQLRELMLATGVERLRDTDQLVGRGCSIKVTIRKQEGYEDSNDIRAYKKGAGSKPSSMPVPSAAAPAASGRAAPPWGGKK